MIEKYISLEFVKEFPYVLVPRVRVFGSLKKPLARLGKHYRVHLEDFHSLVKIENEKDSDGTYVATVHYLAGYIPCE